MHLPQHVQLHRVAHNSEAVTAYAVDAAATAWDTSRMTSIIMTASKCAVGTGLHFLLYAEWSSVRCHNGVYFNVVWFKLLYSRLCPCGMALTTGSAHQQTQLTLIMHGPGRPGSGDILSNSYNLGICNE